MTTALDVTALDIDNWSNKIQAKSQFPDLIRRLILATTPRVLFIDFPANNSVFEGGWDGVTQNAIGSNYVPEGNSGWELGTTKDKLLKANRDYAERTNNSRGLNPSEATIIIVTSRNWGAEEKKKWADTKSAEKIWKEVRLYDAKSIELWLTTAPAVHYWFSKLIGNRPDGATDLESYWLDWSAQTTPSIPASLLLAGRKRADDEINNWLGNSTPTLALRTDSRTEALAIFAAAVQALLASERDAYYARCIVVYNEQAWQDLVAKSTPLILIPLFNDRNQAVSSATRQGHRVFLPLDWADSNWRGSAIEVPRLPRMQIEAILGTIGLPQEKAERLAGVARRSFAAFRRELTDNSSVEPPAWVSADQTNLLITSLLIGAWDEQKEQDTELVAKLAGTSYLEIQNHLVSWTKKADPPVRKVGSTWYIIDKGDVWNLIHEYITQAHLDAFSQLVSEVLTSIPPRYSLPSDEWYRANLLGYESPYSKTLRESLATTLTYMGVFEEPLPAAETSTKRVAEHLVSQLLAKANTDWRIWSAISYYLRWLAEAAPVAFLAAVERGLQGEQPVILELFKERNDPLGTSGDYPGLLWALEVLAWNERYLLRATAILAQLTHLDPGGSLSNRPINSLRDIFLLWHPQTAASLDQRLEVLDQLQEDEPEVIARLLELLSPKAHSISTGTAKPKWREWVPIEEVTRKDVYLGVLAIQERLLNNAAQDINRWATIIKDISEQPYEQKRLIIGKLRELGQNLELEADRIRIRDTIREVVSRHRSFRDTDWAMHPEEVDLLEDAMREFEPSDLVGKYAWLFDEWPLLPEGREQNSEVYETLIAENQQGALAHIYRETGIEGVLSFIPHVKNPFVLGRILVQHGVAEKRALELVTEYLLHEDAAQAHFGLGVAATLVNDKGEAWAESVFNSQVSWSSLQKAQWLLLLPVAPHTWEQLGELDEQAQDYYWQHLNPYRIQEEDVEAATRLLIQHKQAAKAIELLGRNIYRGKAVPTELALEVLEKLFFEASENLPSSHMIEEILEKLADTPDVDRQRVIRLEFHFLPSSYYYRKGKSTKLIFKELAENPLFFAELVSIVFRAEGTVRSDLTPDETYNAHASWSTLNSWRDIPGSDNSGNINKETLFEWVKQARKLTEENGRKTIGEQQIGQMLSGSPKGQDGAWPHEAVRALLEREKSDEIERGFIIGQFNGRGTTTRSPYEGGRQERISEKEFRAYADAIEPRYPRTGAVLNLIADDYARQAKREDDEASLLEDLG